MVHNFQLTNEDERCENCNNNKCTDCLVKELRKENWPNNPEFLTLKIAYEKKIIQTNATSLKELNEDDKKKLKRILYLCAVEDYCNE